MATLTNKQRFVLHSILALIAILLVAGCFVALINAPTNQTTNEVFRYAFSAFIVIIPLAFFADITIYSYKLYNKNNFKYYR